MPSAEAPRPLPSPSREFPDAASRRAGVSQRWSWDKPGEPQGCGGNAVSSPGAAVPRRVCGRGSQPQPSPRRVLRYPGPGSTERLALSRPAPTLLGTMILFLFFLDPRLCVANLVLGYRDRDRTCSLDVLAGPMRRSLGGPVPTLQTLGPCCLQR